MSRIAFPGVPGSYSHLAASRYFPDHAAEGARDFGGVIQAVRSGRARLGLLPVENTVIGPIHEARATLADATDLRVIDEKLFPVDHCLLGLPGATLAEIRWVESHPAALAQCARWLKAHGLRPRLADDTAGAARELALDRDYTRAAIASAEAAERYGLVVLARQIADQPENATRFVVVMVGRGEAA